MNNDIVPSLLEEIQKQFDEEIKANEKIKSILIVPDGYRFTPFTRGVETQ